MSRYTSKLARLFARTVNAWASDPDDDPENTRDHALADLQRAHAFEDAYRVGEPWRE